MEYSTEKEIHYAKSFLEEFFNTVFYNKTNVTTYFDQNACLYLEDNKRGINSNGSGIIFIRQIYFMLHNNLEKLNIENYDIKFVDINTEEEKIHTLILIVNGTLKYRNDTDGTAKPFISIFHFKEDNGSFMIIQQLFKVGQVNVKE